MEKDKGVTLCYYGHSAFLWTTAEGVRVLIDPYRNPDPQRDPYDPSSRWFLDEFPPVAADLVLITHPHFDHDAIDCIPGCPTVIRTPGQFRYKDLTVHGVLDIHAVDAGQRGMKNVIFIIDAGGIRFCHLGDNRPQLPSDVCRDIGSVDFLMVSVDDSYHLLTYREVDYLINTIGPKVVIPMHYLIPGIIDEESTLKTIEQWLSTQTNVYHIEQHTLTITPAEIPRTREIWVLSPYTDTANLPSA
jgi:L-ascorbate metabolism protein UlaG (beta-lactamase superfamily)